jgi:predicted nucleotidyltransferase
VIPILHARLARWRVESEDWLRQGRRDLDHARRHRRGFEERYRPDPNVAAVYLFGSFARGKAVPGSDVDLLVVLRDDPRPPRERIVDYLPERFPIGVDFVPWTEAELDERLARGDRMAHTILAEGEALLDRRITHSPRA